MVAAGLLGLGALAWFQVTAPGRLRAGVGAAGLKATDLSIREMGCSLCRAAILRSLERLDGVTQVAPSRKGVTVAYDPARLTPERIADLVTRETGYVARPLQTSSEVNYREPGGATVAPVAAGSPEVP